MNIAKLHHWNLIFWVDITLGYNYKTKRRMCLSLVFVADSAGGIKSHT